MALYNKEKASFEANKKKFKELLSEIEMTEDEVWAHCKAEYQLWYNFVNMRRIKFRDRRRLYNEVLKDPDKVSTNDIYAVMQTLLAIYYMDDLMVNFLPRNPWYDEMADNIQNLAKFDYDEMDMNTLTYRTQRDRLFYGVGIRQLMWYDEQRQVPMWDVKDPLTWIPDPAGSHSTDRFRFMGFESKGREEDLTPELGYFDIEKTQIGFNPESQLTDIAESQPRALNIMPEWIENGYRAIYYHFTTIKGIKYLVVMWYPTAGIIKMEKIMAMSKAEKKNPKLIKFPVVLNYYDPLRWDPFGTSIPDLIEDKQRARSRNFNLNLIKSTYEALGGITLYNPYAVRNANDLETPTVGKKYIPVNPEFSWWRIDNIIYDTNNANKINPDSTASIEALRQEEYNSTNIDTTQMGIQWDTSQTATANQNIQLNANVKFLLKNKINAWGEKDFWTLWYKCYRVAFSGADEKFIRLNSNRAIKTATLKRNDFITEYDPSVQIVSKSEHLQQQREDKANFMAFAPMLLQDPNIPKLSRTYILRKICKLNWADRDEILEEVPPYLEELKAKDGAILIDMGRAPAKITNMNEDHMTYLMIYSWCEDSDVKSEAISKRRAALMKQMEEQQKQQQAPQQQPGQQSNPNIMTNQMSNNSSAMLSNNMMQSQNSVAKNPSQQSLG